MKYWFGALLLFTQAAAVEAEIYKSVDAAGHVTYSNMPSKGAKKLYMEPLTTMPKPKAARGEYKVDTDTQKRRDDTRRKILEDELAQEESRLGQARDAASHANGDAQKKIMDEISLHQKNIDALIHEIANLK